MRKGTFTFFKWLTFYNAAQRLDFFTVDGIQIDAKLETVIFWRIMAGRYHDPALPFKVFNWKVKNRCRAYTDIHYIASGG